MEAHPHDDAADTTPEPADAPIRMAAVKEPEPRRHEPDDLPLFADIDELGRRWADIQAMFVDDPRETIERADALVADVMSRVNQRLAEQRALLEGSWRRGEEATTETLRVALQHYRSFFQRLLTT